jgi:broad specificity phosphatase PhoE
MPKRQLILVRHGQYDLETGELTENGIAQARYVAARLRELGIGQADGRAKVAIHYTSGLLRARETSAEIAQVTGLAAKKLPLLNEGFPSRVKGYPTDTIAEDRARFAEAASRFLAPLGDPLRSARLRSAATGRGVGEKNLATPPVSNHARGGKASKSEETGQGTPAHRFELLVCHGNLIRYLVCVAMGVAITRWTRLGINHASLTRIVVREDGRAGVIGFNDIGHLPEHLVT